MQSVGCHRLFFIICRELFEYLHSVGFTSLISYLFVRFGLILIGDPRFLQDVGFLEMVNTRSSSMSMRVGDSQENLAIGTQAKGRQCKMIYVAFSWVIWLY